MATQHPANFHAIHVGQHQIKNDEIGRPPLNGFESLAARIGGNRLKPGLFEVITYQVKNVWIPYGE